ncbi:MAG TPA: hypothetical protein VJJ53_03205 [Candidatus Nanoarchaeia archaeon]|nr:hypothetical protein [Candidatus Nanoarchaeia archaeon]
MKKGDIWISAVLYTGISIAVLVLILAASTPLINKARDENTVTQTKLVMLELDKNIRTVISEGAGSQRIFSLEIGRGKMFIDQSNDSVSWNLETKVLVSEPGVAINLGNLQLLEEEVGKDNYLVNLKLDYGNIADIFSKEATIAGRYDLIILNNESLPGRLPKVLISSR